MQSASLHYFTNQKLFLQRALKYSDALCDVLVLNILLIHSKF